MKTMSAKYHEYRALQIILLCASLSGLATSFLPNVSFFIGLSFIYLWWFIPAQFDYLPFFWEGLRQKPRTIGVLFKVIILWIPCMWFLSAVDFYFDLALTELVFGTFSLARAFITAGVYTFLGLIIPFGKAVSEKFFSRVKVKVVRMYQKGVIVLGHGEMIYMSHKDVEKGFPIHVRNGSRESIAISNVIFEATTLSIPISFIKRHLVSADHRGQYVEHNIPLKEIVLVDVGKSKLIHVPFDELEKGSAKAIMMIKKFPERFIRTYIAIYDPFSHKEFRSEEILHLISKRQWPFSFSKPQRKKN